MPEEETTTLNINNIEKRLRGLIIAVSERMQFYDRCYAQVKTHLFKRTSTNANLQDRNLFIYFHPSRDA